jgi:YD repeat-containing protein
LSAAPWQLFSWPCTPPSCADNETADPGQTTFRDKIANLDFEQIDPYTGTLSLTHKDISIPGNGGLDFELYRTYRTDRESEYTVFGFGWDSHFGRIKKVNDLVTIELQDGTTSSAIKEKLDTAWHTYYIYYTKDFWKVNMQGTPTLQLTDGTEIVFGRGGTSSYDNWYYATEIRRNNNTMFIHYGIERRVNYVMDSDYRRFDFHYQQVNGGAYRLIYVTCVQDTGQPHLVTYAYPATGTNTVLQEVTLSDNEKWKYQYDTFQFENNQISRYWLKKITTPYGGTITYDYDSYIRTTTLTGYRFQLSIKTKQVAGSNLTSGTWNYEYGYKDETFGNPIHLDYTTITDPCGRSTMYHFYGYTGGYDENTNQPGCYKYGLTRQKFTTNSSGQLEEAVEYSWDKLTSSLSPQPYSVEGVCTDASTYVPVLTQQTIYRGGSLNQHYLLTENPDDWGVDNPDDLYVTQYSDFDNYGNTETTKEFDSLPGALTNPKKAIETTFWTNPTRNIVKGVPETVLVKGQLNSFPGDFKTIYTYDSYANQKSENRYGVVTSHTYFSNGNLKSTTDANNHTISYTWDNGAIKQITNPEYTINRIINWDGTTETETNGRGFQTAYTYTPGMRLKSITPLVGNTTDYDYQFGADTWSKETRGNFFTQTFYDGLGRERRSEDAIGKTTTTVYKACGLKDSTSSNTGDTVQYDIFGRIITITHKDNSHITYTHHTDQYLEIIDEVGKHSHQHFATFGTPVEKYLISVKNADNHTTEYQYSILGNLLKSTFDLVTARTFYYNNKNFLEWELHPESGYTRYTYDYVGNVKTKDNGVKKKTYTYDTINRLRSVEADSKLLEYTWDKADNLEQAVSPDATIDNVYDTANRMESTTLTAQTQINALIFSWDDNDNPETIQYPSGKTITYGYNDFNQIIGITGFGSTVSDVQYYTTGTRLGLLYKFTYGNGQTTTLSYDDRRAMTTTASTALHLGFSYTDKRGNMTGLTNYLDRAKDKTFDYDNLSRLRIHNGAWGNGTFTYYANGNRWQKLRNGSTTYIYQANRLNSAAGTSYGYDAAGNMASAGAFIYDHTPFDRMNQIKENNSIILTSGFDGNGNRVFKTATGRTTLYLRDFSGRVLSKMDSSGTFYNDYIYLGSNLVAKDNVPDPNGDGIAEGIDPDPLVPAVPDIGWLVPAIYLPLLVDGE